jgi:hypothetical protein
VLAKILERAAAVGLSPLAWTVESAGAALLGRAVAHPMDRRRDDWNDWRAAVARWAGSGADVKREYTDSHGTTRLTDQWERYERVTLTLVADLYAED